MSHNNLASYYKLTYSLAQVDHFTIPIIEDMIPFERDIYFGLRMQFVEETKET